MTCSPPGATSWTTGTSPYPWRFGAIILLLLGSAAAGCGKEAPGTDAAAADSAAWVGKENVALAERDTLESVPAEREREMRSSRAGSLQYEGTVPVEALPTLRVGMPVRFTVPGAPGEQVRAG